MTSERNTSDTRLRDRLDHLEHQNHRIVAEAAQMQARFQAAQRRMRVQAGLACVALTGAIFLSPANRAAIAQGYGVSLQQLAGRLAAVEGKTQYISVAGGEMYVKGTNLHIENGLPDPGLDNLGHPIAPALNGKGNLIVGYNTPIGFGADARTGSHNLIVGTWNNYSSYGGMVLGLQNTISAPYACVSGGTRNTAAGQYSSVSGGFGSIAGGIYSSVSGGSGNYAGGFYASVSGGLSNTAGSNYASVSGGLSNTAGGLYSSISGGANNTASGYTSSVSGGDRNTAGGYFSSVSGGFSVLDSTAVGWAAGNTNSDLTNVSGTYHSN